MRMPYFVNGSSVDGHLVCFHFLAVVSSAAMNIPVQVFVGKPVFQFFGYRPRSGVAVIW